MPELQRLRAGHAPAVLAFELANRAYFAASVSDRGDEFYDLFTERHSALLAEQEAGIGAYYVLVAEDGSVLGRFNLYRFEDGTAELGYRVAQHVAGRGVATATVRELCGLAAAQYRLRTLKAATSRENAASQKVLARAGFIPVGPADPADLGGKQGTWYQRDLVQPLSSSLLVRGYAVSRSCGLGEVLLPRARGLSKMPGIPSLANRPRHSRTTLTLRPRSRSICAFPAPRRGGQHDPGPQHQPLRAPWPGRYPGPMGRAEEPHARGARAEPAASGYGFASLSVISSAGHCPSRADAGSSWPRSCGAGPPAWVGQMASGQLVAVKRQDPLKRAGSRSTARLACQMISHIRIWPRWRSRRIRAARRTIRTAKVTVARSTRPGHGWLTAMENHLLWIVVEPVNSRMASAS